MNVTRNTPPTFHLRFGDHGTVDHLGVAHLIGTYDCADAIFAGVFGQAAQGKRTGSISANGSLDCDGHRQTFTATATASEGNHRFTPGKLAVEFSLIACNQGGCIQPPPGSQLINLQPTHQ